MYVDETYYNDVFKGEPVESADFPTLCQRAGEIIEEMTLYRLTEEGFLMMSSTQWVFSCFAAAHRFAN